MDRTVDQVIGALALPGSYREWIDALAAVEPVRCELPDAGSAEARRLFETVMLDERDARELIQLWPDRRWSDAHRWVLDRLRGVISRDLGRDAGFEWPGLTDIEDDRLRCAPVFAFLSAIPELCAWHEARGVPREVSETTLRDIGRHTAKNRAMFGRIGLEVASFIALQFRGYLYEVGRLQYEPVTLATRRSVVWYTEEEAAELPPELKPGAGAVSIHIAEGGRLDRDSVADSLRAGRRFFAEAFGIDYPIAICTSWLLDPQLADYLRPESNIIRFQRMFTLVDPEGRREPGGVTPVAPGGRGSGGGDAVASGGAGGLSGRPAASGGAAATPEYSNGDRDVFRFVFRMPRVDPVAVEPATSLERAVVDLIRSGGHWRVPTGWLRLPE